MSNKSNEHTVNLCIRGTGAEADWRVLYEKSFPRDERMSLEELDVMIKRQLVLVHRTTDEADNLLCFSITTPMSNFSLLAYIATDQERRSSGVGSRHMRALIGQLKSNYPRHRGLFLEIESTRENGLTPQESNERTRRLSFYERLGCRRLIGADYLLPSYLPGSAPRQGELLWFEYGSPPPAPPGKADPALGAIICEIYIRGYGVSNRDDSFVKVMSQFPGVDDSTCGIKSLSDEIAGDLANARSDSTQSSPPVAEPQPPVIPQTKSWGRRLLSSIHKLLRRLGLSS